MGRVIRTARITSEGQITVPKEVRDRLGVEPGDALEFSVDERAERAEVRAIKRRSIGEFRGMFKPGRADGASDKTPDWSTQLDRAWGAAAARLAQPRGSRGTRG
ncbi:MAG: AbrB/MazE/SpoVT family DNA-binding domain-containing protein [Chloroflexota bacterium]